MTPLAGFLDVLLRGFGLVVLSLAVGGVAFAVVALRAFGRPSRLERAAASRSLTVIAWSGLGLVLTHVAVIVGCGRWLELRLPPPENRIPGRVWAAAMVLIGILLVFYREV